MALFIIDFDRTITSENTHNAVSHLTNGKINDIWAIVKEISPTGSPEIWRETLRSIIAEGHSLAIASFNAYGPIIIPKYLKEVIGLSDDEIERIHIESWLPLNSMTADKNRHIEYSIKDINYQGSSDSIVLVDDDLKNIIAAQKKGYRTIYAKGDFIKKINWDYLISSHKLSSKFFEKTNPDKQINTLESSMQCTII